MKSYIYFVARILIGALFLLSGFSKLIQPYEYFQIAISMYQIVPDGFLPITAMLLPWIEMLFGTYLLIGYFQNMSATVLLALTAIFQLILAQALLRRLPIDECGCFGAGNIHLTLYQSFTLDTVIALALIFISTDTIRMYSLDNYILRHKREKPN